MGAAGAKPAQFPVRLNVYNLAGGNVSDAILSAVAGGGLYHTGLEIDGVEYAFGGGNGKGSGVWAQQPHKLPSCFGGATFKEAVNMGVSEPLTRKDLHVIMHQKRSHRLLSKQLFLQIWDYTVKQAIGCSPFLMKTWTLLLRSMHALHDCIKCVNWPVSNRLQSTSNRGRNITTVGKPSRCE